MKKALSLALSLILILGSVSLCLPTAASALLAAENSREKVTLLAEFEDSAVLDKADLNTAAAKIALSRIRENRVSPLKAIAATVKNFTVMYSYTHVLNGIAFEASRGDIEKIEAISGIKKVYEISGVTPITDTVTKGSAEGFTGSSMTGADALHDLGYTGKGTAVAVIDGGLDVNHEAMALTDEASAKIKKSDVARVIAGGLNAENATVENAYKSAKVPFVYDYLDNDTDAMDDHNSEPDHGTHVSGIVAGNCENLSGVAPEAQILMFKIDVYDDDAFLANLLAAIDDAAKFDIAAINMSVGMACESRNDPAYELMNEAITVAHNNGITVCAAAGNEDRFSTDTANLDNAVNGIPNSLDNSFSVASADNTALQFCKTNIPNTIVTGGGSTYYVWAYSELATGLPFGQETACVPLYIGSSHPNLSGKYALIFDTQNSRSLRSQASLYAAMIPEDAAGIILSDDLVDLAYYLPDYPIITVSGYDALSLAHQGTQAITVNDYEQYLEPAEEGSVSYFTSYGVNEDLTMSVDIAAPGGNILSSVTQNRYDVYSGTSMASPHVAGGAALLNQYLATAYPTLSGKALADFKENLLMSTADPILYEGAAISPRRVGAGMLDLEGAVKAKAVLAGDNGKAALNLGDNLDDTFALSFTVQNIADTPVTYDTLSLYVTTDAVEDERNFNTQTGEYETTTYLNGNSVNLPYRVIESDMPAHLTVMPGESAAVTLTVQLDEAALKEKEEIFKNGFYVEGYAVLSDSAAAETELSLPFMGFYGDWLALPAYEAVTDSDTDTVSYYALRSIRKATYDLLDENGISIAHGEEEYLCKGNQILPGIEDLDVTEGVYSVLVTLWLEADADNTSSQTFTVENYRVDRTCRVTGFNYKTEDGKRYTVTITSPDDDIRHLVLEGATLSNRDYYDVIEISGPTGQDGSGNYTYTLVLYGADPAKMICTVSDSSYNEVSYGSYSFFYRLLMLFRRLFSF